MTDRIDQIEDIIDSQSGTSLDMGNESDYSNVNDIAAVNDTKCFIYEGGEGSYIDKGMIEHDVFYVHLKSDTRANLETAKNAILKLDTEGIDTTRYNYETYTKTVAQTYIQTGANDGFFQPDETPISGEFGVTAITKTGNTIYLDWAGPHHAGYWSWDLSSYNIRKLSLGQITLNRDAADADPNNGFYCIAADNLTGTTFTTDTYTLTTATATFTAAVGSGWSTYTITDPINEVIARAGWGGNVVIIDCLKADAGDHSFWSYEGGDGAGSIGARINFTYYPADYPLMISVEPYRKYNETFECILKITGRWLI